MLEVGSQQTVAAQYGGDTGPACRRDGDRCPYCRQPAPRVGDRATGSQLCLPSDAFIASGETETTIDAPLMKSDVASSVAFFSISQPIKAALSGLHLVANRLVSQAEWAVTDLHIPVTDLHIPVSLTPARTPGQGAR